MKSLNEKWKIDYSHIWYGFRGCFRVWKFKSKHTQWKVWMKKYNSVYSHAMIAFANKVQTYTMKNLNESKKGSVYLHDTAQDF